MRNGGRILTQTQRHTPTNATNSPIGTRTNHSATGNLSNQTRFSESASENAIEAANWLFGLFQQWGLPPDVAKLLLTIVVFGVTWYASKFITQLLERRVVRRFRRPSISRTILRIIRLSVIGAGVLFIIGAIYNISVGNIVLSVTVFSAIVGVVLAPIVGSVISGLFVITNQPYEVGDMIELVDTDRRGYVEDITIRYTKIFTLDNTFLVVPNGTMRDRDVINYSAEDARTRFNLDIGVTYESDIGTARSLIEDAAREVDGVINGGPDIRIGSARYPAAPTCIIDEFGGSSVQLTLRYWLKEPYQPRTMRSQILNRIWKHLNDADVELAYPHSHVVFDETSGELNINLTRENETSTKERSWRTPETNADD